MSENRLSAKRSTDLLTAVLAFSMLLISGVYLYQSAQISILKASSHQYLLASLKAADGSSRETVGLPDPNVLTTALKAQPLNPVIVNAAMFAKEARKSRSDLGDTQIELLERLGWRSTPALQNRIVVAVEKQDLGKIVAIGDALLRREELMDQTQALMRLLEQSGSTRRQLAGTLAFNPYWRQSYFESANKLQGSAAVANRAQLAMMLAKLGSPLTRPELAANLGVLIDNGYGREAYQLWRAYRKVQAMLINDPGFSWAYRMRNDVNVGMPFEWQLLSGSGFWTELVRENGKTAVSINWNRRGVPAFLTQRLFLGSQRPGLVMQINGTELPATFSNDFSLALVCPGRSINFDQLLHQSKTRYEFTSRDQLSCVDPMFVLAGRPLKVTSTNASLADDGISVQLASISLRRIID